METEGEQDDDDFSRIETVPYSSGESEDEVKNNYLKMN